MNIYTIRDNLKRTIAGKEKFLLSLKQDDPLMTAPEWLASVSAKKFVEINLAELQKILEDVELCIEQGT